MQATSTPKIVDQRPAFLALLAGVLFAAGIALGAALPGLDLKIAPSAAVAPDTSYSAVEGARAQFGVAPDTSYDTVESLRAKAGVTVATTPTLKGRSGYPSTRSRGITAHDKARGNAGWWATAPATPARIGPDSTYGPTAAAPVAGTTSAGQEYLDWYLRSLRAVAPVAGTPTSQADPDTRFGAGIR